MDAHKNPFRTARTDHLPYVPTDRTVDEIWSSFKVLGYRGAVIGPHGSGKSTLIRELVRRAENERMSYRIRRAVRNGRRVEWMWSGEKEPELELVDGFDLLSWPKRAALRFSRDTKLIVTAHSIVPGLPILHRCITNEELLRSLFATLETSELTQSERGFLLHQHNGNIREVLRSLYDRNASTEYSLPSGKGNISHRRTGFPEVHRPYIIRP